MLSFEWSTINALSLTIKFRGLRLDFGTSSIYKSDLCVCLNDDEAEKKHSNNKEVRQATFVRSGNDFSSSSSFNLFRNLQSCHIEWHISMFSGSSHYLPQSPNSCVSLLTLSIHLVEKASSPSFAIYLHFQSSLTYMLFTPSFNAFKPLRSIPFLLLFKPFWLPPAYESVSS